MGNHILLASAYFSAYINDMNRGVAETNMCRATYRRLLVVSPVSYEYIGSFHFKRGQADFNSFQSLNGKLHHSLLDMDCVLKLC